MITEISTYTGVSVEDILGNSRSEDICDARHVYWYALKQSGFSYSAIGRLCEREHSTIYAGIRRVEQLKYSDTRIRYLLERTKEIKR
jgi:chromosomal replication initiation ATPase DnaA